MACPGCCFIRIINLVPNHVCRSRLAALPRLGPHITIDGRERSVELQAENGSVRNFLKSQK